MTDIHYFPRYSQRENVITNNTLLLLLRFYNHDQFKFAKLMRHLLRDDADVAGAIGLQFKQQRGTGATIAVMACLAGKSEASSGKIAMQRIGNIRLRDFHPNTQHDGLTAGSVC